MLKSLNSTHEALLDIEKLLDGRKNIPVIHLNISAREPFGLASANNGSTPVVVMNVAPQLAPVVAA